MKTQISARRPSSLLNLLPLLIAIALPAAAYAQDQSSGCGLGWEVTSKNSLVSSAVRSFTNAILPNTFSMTFGTSGCASHSIVKNDEKAVLYAVSNQDALIAEMAEGQGEFLYGFSQALGCDEASYGQLRQVLRSDYSQLVPQFSGRPSAAPNVQGIELYQAVRGRMLKDPVLAQHCIPRA